MTDQELADFAFDAKRLTDAVNERLRGRGKRQRIDVMDGVELLHAIGRYLAFHDPLDGGPTSTGSPPPTRARRSPDAETAADKSNGRNE